MNDRFLSDDLPRNGASARPIDLAHHPSFRLGDVEVHPATRELVRGEQRELLEPLVMQVLIALASARGQILSRDDLIDCCWGGRAVTDDALNRVLSRLRALARTFGAFEIETINKVGYRLVADSIDAARPAQPLSRRRVLVGGSILAGLGLFGFAAWRGARPNPDTDQSALLLQKGLDALQNNDALEAQDPGSSVQAIVLLTDAARADPDSSIAWGSLAIAYAVRTRTAPLSERPGIAARSRAAARTALKLEPGSERAIAAMRMLDPVYRNWIAAERSDRDAVARNAKLPILYFIMSDMLGNVGRWKEAAASSSRLDRKKFLIPGADSRLLIDLWGASELQRSDDVLEVALRQWPQNPQIWRTRIAYLTYSGRPLEVLALLENPADRPIEIRAENFEAARITAEALAGKRPARETVGRLLQLARSIPTSGLQIAQACVALGEQAAAFDLFDGYYFNEGKWAFLAPAGGDLDRVTKPLFQPMMRPVWQSAPFNRLLARIGLEEYWRRTGTLPDYRRA